MECPRCKEVLTKQNIEDQEIIICKSCKGMWLHRNQLNHLLDEDVYDLEKCSIDNNSHNDKFPAIRCRECENVIMRKINFLDYSDIILDYCSSCGSIWVDANEVIKMKNYIEKVEKGSHDIKNISGYNILAKLSEIAYRIYH